MFLSKTIVAIYWLIWPFLHWPWPPLTANEYLCDGTSQSQVNPCHIAKLESFRHTKLDHWPVSTYVHDRADLVFSRDTTLSTCRRGCSLRRMTRLSDSWHCCIYNYCWYRGMCTVTEGKGYEFRQIWYYC